MQDKQQKKTEYRCSEKTEDHRLKKAEDIRRYIFGCRHRAIVTLIPKKTGTHFTYRFRRFEGQKNFFFTDALVGPDNRYDYSSCGTIHKNHFGQWVFRYDTGSSFRDSEIRIHSLDWFIRSLNRRRGLISKDLEVFHAGICSNCGRELTNPESLQYGLGPICRIEAKTRF